MRATISKPTGFSDQRPEPTPVEIVGYLYGPHIDGGGYDRRKDCAQAVYVINGRLEAAPLSWFEVSASKEPRP